ncbi:hypothetical protein [Pedobacter sp. SYSU D00535]|uniref:hypothetical protein n=1 Tax=Pedobacter sp. SYSU D00535 TaxID=2810308 RepID=UPI001A967831|nr:hypothetical protein [Pedobacter sp. SYSU D00535]
MEASLNKDNPEVRLRAFRAVDDQHACELFVQGHEHVLASIGVTKVTSSKNGWISNPGAFVLIVESLDGSKVYGGARVHVSGGSELLPLEQATGAIDPNVFELVWKHAQYGAGELCGLWNSREIAGYGIGSIFLIRAAVAIATQIGLKSLFALCAPYTVKPVESVGMHLEPSVGKDGTFYYPKQDLVATTMVVTDLDTLKTAEPEHREAIFAIRNNFNTTRLETLRNKEITIHYETKIPNLDQWDLNQIISNAYTNFLSAKPDTSKASFPFG